MNTITKIMAVIMFICVTIVVISINLYLKEKETTKVLITASLNPAIKKEPSLKITKTVTKKQTEPIIIKVGAGYGTNRYNGIPSEKIISIQEEEKADYEKQIEELRNIIEGRYGSDYEEFSQTKTEIEYTGKQESSPIIPQLARSGFKNFGSIGYDFNNEINLQYNRNIYKKLFIGGKLNISKPENSGILASYSW